MANSNLAILDAMIAREDFGTTGSATPTFETVNVVRPSDLDATGLLGLSMRKPDFQRETNHWSPEQVVSLLKCFDDGDLIPSVILWQSPTYVFVIDGGHRLSALRAWVMDDYGDGAHSQTFFGNANIFKNQRKAAERTRSLVNSEIGSWKQLQNKALQPDLPAIERAKVNAISTRGLNIQWVKGDADKAEASFFRINTKGTDLDEVEELLLRNRRKAIPIAARAVIRAGKGHKYWSAFDENMTAEIEHAASDLHTLLFDPEVDNPIKTLDLPLGGPKVRDALSLLIDFSLAAVRNQSGQPNNIEDTPDDATGAETLDALKKMRRVATWVSGNKDGSLGLHPAIYFYGPTGRHSSAMFMGTIQLIARHTRNNNKDWFKQFTSVRSKLEATLIKNKELIATFLQKHLSTKRVQRYEDFLSSLVEHLRTHDSASDLELAKFAALEGKIVLDTEKVGVAFSDDTKSGVFIDKALHSTIKCNICDGFVDATKSISYDHIKKKSEGGNGSKDNLGITHPFCNQGYKA